MQDAKRRLPGFTGNESLRASEQTYSTGRVRFEVRTESLIAPQGTCTCGSADVCDTIAGYWVRCFEDSAGDCNWHTTYNVCP